MLQADKIIFYHSIFKDFLKNFEEELEGCNYGIELGFKLYELKGDEGDPLEILSYMSNEKTNYKTKAFMVSRNQVYENVKHKILSANEFLHYPDHYDDEFIQKIINQRVPKLFSHIQNYVRLNNSECYQCEDVPDMPWFNIFWSFCHLIIDRKRKRALVIYGGASD